ncbi:hypothetical protein [Bradyrhizobium sp. 191]|uniref:hypothetical protein n=1 Tax=Bradyrhizobium sp. 191 TaxID=2782659 RepID=UPI001FFF2D10|nr:hypothetical protein [Bradyrhizobium sp. 191]UPJ65236.1 hypothetical protein IVB23_35825 [Bradyrhizobium sp. 191]
MFFVVRTDVSAQDGLQRVFGAFDTQLEAERFMAGLQAHMRGEFAVFEGHPVA